MAKKATRRVSDNSRDSEIDEGEDYTFGRMSPEDKNIPESVIAEKVAAGMSRADAVKVAQAQYAHDRKLEEQGE